jgi:hypothetical protein
MDAGMEIAAEATVDWVWASAAQAKQIIKADAASRRDERKVITLALAAQMGPWLSPQSTALPLSRNGSYKQTLTAGSLLNGMAELSLNLIAAAFPPTKGGHRK